MIYDFEITGTMPLIMHRDNIEGDDLVREWQQSEAGKSSRAGDDRGPAWRWQFYLYHDEERVVIPQGNLMAALLFGGTKTRTGKGQATYKQLSQSGIIPLQEFFPLLVDGEEIPLKDIKAIEDESFAEQARLVKDFGFSLFVKRCTPPGQKSKHVRVRPRFENWSFRGQVQVQDALISREILERIFDTAGRMSGIGDWRPSSPSKPGPYGTFTSKVAPAK